MRALALTAAVFVGVGTVGIRSAVQPDFSGRWFLVDSQPTGSAALGFDVTIVQTGMTIQLNRWTVGSPDTRSSVEAPDYDALTTYDLGGAEHPTKTQFIGMPLRKIAGPSGVHATTEDSISKATWVGRALVLMSYNKNRWSTGGRESSSFTTRQTVRQVLSTDSRGLLEVESLVVADPHPGARSVTTPTPVKSTYRRQP